ncbi:MAG TPA: metallophosphoesterase [Thermoleophilaceae bacterium]|jgi:3',5'-cyclic AMP phosphodiesterase CpdA
MRLYATGDLHLTHRQNVDVAASFPYRPDDWLALVGDVGVTAEHLREAFELVRPRFARVLWVPGNHELWTHPSDPDQDRGEERYLRLVELCRSYDVLTPEDPYAECDLGGERLVVAPLFTLYDYSFRQPGETKEEALDEARRAGAFCADERLLHPDPHASREEWCHARVRATEARLAALPSDRRTVLIAHFPLRQDVVRLPRIPRFSPWCGTKLTEDWHVRFRAAAVVGGHLHVPGTLWRDGVPFSEVSLGYPQQWSNRPWPHGAPREVQLGAAN